MRSAFTPAMSLTSGQLRPMRFSLRRMSRLKQRVRSRIALMTLGVPSLVSVI
jgi:hypothetical protein